MVNDTAARCAACHTTVHCCSSCCFSCHCTLLPVMPRHATTDHIIIAALCPVVAVALPSVTPSPVVSGHHVIIAARVVSPQSCCHMSDRGTLLPIVSSSQPHVTLPLCCCRTICIT